MHTWVGGPTDLQPAIQEYGISSFVYRADRPFHSERLATMLQKFSFPGMLRSKGILWCSGNNESAVEWSSAGLIGEIKPGPRCHLSGSET